MPDLIKKKYILLILLIPLILIFFPTLFLGKTLFYRDISIHDYPLNQYIIESYKSGEFPLWNPYLFSGLPQMASLQPAMFYPSILIFLFLPFHIAFSISLIIHYFLSGLGIYLIGRYWSLSKTASLTGGIVFALNGYMFELTSLSYILYAVTWVPYIFLFTNKILDKPAFKDFYLLLLFFALQLSTGRIDYFYFTQIFLWIWIGYRFLNTKDKNDKLQFSINSSFIMIISVISILLLALQIFPSLEFLKTTRRNDSLDLEIATIWSLHPLQLLNMCFSNFFGNLFYTKGISRLISTDRDLTFLIYNLYFGFVPIILSIYSLIRKDRKALFLFFIAIVFTFCSFGKYSPVYEIFFNYFPGFQATRYPAKLFIFPLFFVSLMVSLGFEKLQQEKSDFLLRASILTLTLVFLFSIVGYLFKADIQNIISIKIHQEINNIDFVFKSLILPIFFLLLFIILLLLAKYNKLKQNKLIFLIIILITADLTINNVSNLWTVDKSELYNKPQIVQDIENKIENKENYQILQDNESYIPIINQESKVLSDFRNALSSNNFNLSVLYKLHNAFGYYPGEPSKIAIVISAINDEIPGLSLSNKTKAFIMRMMGIRFFIWHTKNISTKPLDSTYFTLVKEYPEIGIQLWEIKDFLPRFNFKTKAFVTDSDETILKAILAPEKLGFDSEIVVLKNNHNYRKALSLIKKDKNNQITNVKINLIEEKNNSILFEVELPESGYLTITNRFDKGWKAFDNNEETPILESNYFQQAIRIASGKHHIEFKYCPKSFSIFGKISFITLFFLLFFIIVKNRSIQIYKSKPVNQEFVTSLILAILISSLLIFPLLSSYLRTPEDFTFIGFDTSMNFEDSVTDADMFTYISKMRQGYEGNILYQNRYTIEESGPTALFIFYTMLGNIARVLNLNLIFCYFLSLFLLNILLIMFIYRFCSLFIFSETEKEQNKEISQKRIKWKILVVILISASTGYSFFYKLFSLDNIKAFNLPADVIYPEFTTFFSMMDISHFTFCIILMLLIYKLLLTLPLKTENCIRLSICNFILALVHPFDYITVSSVSMSYLFIQVFIKKNKDYSNSLWKILIAIGIGFIPILYMYYVLNNNEVLRLTLKNNNALNSPPVISYLMGYGTNIIFAFLGIFYLVKKKIKISNNLLFIFTWIIVNFALLYSPFPFQRRFMMGLQIPVIIFAVITLKQLFTDKKLLFKTLIVSLVFFTVFPTSLIILYSKSTKFNLFIDSDIISVFDWINKNNISGKNFLSYDKLGLYTPAFSGNKVFLGHWGETINFYSRKELVKKFFSIESEKQIKFLKDLNIDYLIYGPDEKKLGRLHYSKSLEKVYSIGMYDLIKVIK